MKNINFPIICEKYNLRMPRVMFQNIHYNENHPAKTYDFMKTNRFYRIKYQL